LTNKLDIFSLENDGKNYSYGSHAAQHAYPKNMSCETVLHDLFSRIKVALNHKIFAFGTFFGDEGAFDNASFDSKIAEIHRHSVDHLSTRCFDSMLRNRTVKTEIRSVSSTMEVRKGCPQGGVPILFGDEIEL
jgi:hypothetical protein